MRIARDMEGRNGVTAQWHNGKALEALKALEAFKKVKRRKTQDSRGRKIKDMLRQAQHFSHKIKGLKS